MYTFLFDRRSMTLLLTGATLAAVLVFASGFLLGLWVNLPRSPVAAPEFAALSGGWQPTVDGGAAAVVEEPVPAEDEAAGADEPAPPPPAVRSVPVEAPPAASTEAVFPAPAAERPARDDPPAEPALPVFSVQVASFLVRSRAEVFAEDLRERGWEPYIVETTFPSGRPVITVRVGSYDRFEEARRAARTFEARENVATTVRWSDLGSPSRESESRVSS